MPAQEPSWPNPQVNLFYSIGAYTKQMVGMANIGIEMVTIAIVGLVMVA